VVSDNKYYPVSEIYQKSNGCYNTQGIYYNLMNTGKGVIIMPIFDFWQVRSGHVMYKKKPQRYKPMGFLMIKLKDTVINIGQFIQTIVVFVIVVKSFRI
jgi:hypothetical protein